MLSLCKKSPPYFVSNIIYFLRQNIKARFGQFLSKQVFHAFRLKSGIFLLPVQQAVVKTYMACAFGMEACKQYYKTRYVRMPDLLMDLNIARTEGNYRKTMAKYSNPVLLILDE